MAKINTLSDAFTAATINTGLWNSITGTATLDTVNDLVVLAVPTVNGTTTAFGTTSTWDATGSSLSAQIGVAANGNGGTTTALKLSLNTSNNIAIRVAAGIFGAVLTTGGTPAVSLLPTYDPHAHRWWRISESGGQFLIAAGADGLNWTTLATITYGWSATAVTVAFQTAATVTEAAGNAATIQHLNTPLGGPANPAWPLVEYGWGARWNCNGADSPLDRYVDQSTLTRGSVSISRGRQYELDQVRSGEMSLSLANPAGALDPTNAAGPYAGHILPFQPYRHRAQWPPTRNLLNQFQATGGDQGGIVLGPIDQFETGPATLCSTDSVNFKTVTSATAWQGSTVIQALVPSGTSPVSGTSAAGLICWTAQPGAAPGATYTMQMRVRNITAATTLQVTPIIYSETAASVGTPHVGSTTTLTGAATAWTTLTLTATLGADAAYMVCGVGVAATNAADTTVQIDGWQLESGTVASAWACPAPWSPIFGGFVERWPSTWTMSGTYGMVQPTATDALSLLSQRILDDPLTAEIQSHNPRFLYQLGDPAGSTSAAEATGAYPPAPLANGKNGASSVTFGTAITATDPVGGIYTGSTGTVAHFNNPNVGQNVFGPCTYLSLTQAGITGPADPAGEWTRVIAFRYTGPTPAYGAQIWFCADNQRSGGGGSLAGSRWSLYVNTSGHLQLDLNGPTGTGAAFTPSVDPVNDGNWHLVILSYSHAAAQLAFRIDGTASTYSSFSTALEPTGLTMDNIGALVDEKVHFTTANYGGEIGFVAEFPAATSSTDRNNLYTAWKSSCAGESTDARYARILRYAGYAGPSSLQAGLTTSMGPAAFGGQDTVTALQGVVDTEGGEHYVDRSGTITFRSRSVRYNALTPAYIFGERADLGEWPYEDCQLDYDSTHLANVVTVTQDATGQAFNAQDATSITNYFPRTLTRAVNSSNPLECQDAAGYLLSRYKNPATRVSAIKLHPSANPQMWPTCLALELGTRVRVMRRPPGAPAITVECFVENIAWELDDTGEATVTLQCSPADTTLYEIFAAWHTTLKNAVTVGATSITVNASQDTANPLATQLAAGEQLTLGQGTANQEVVTISAVGATSPGWTSAVITLTAAATKTHAVGDGVCDQLQAGATDPTAFDASSVLDATAFAY